MRGRALRKAERRSGQPTVSASTPTRRTAAEMGQAQRITDPVSTISHQKARAESASKPSASILKRDFFEVREREALGIGGLEKGQTIADLDLSVTDAQGG